MGPSLTQKRARSVGSSSGVLFDNVLLFVFAVCSEPLLVCTVKQRPDSSVALV